MRYLIPEEQWAALTIWMEARGEPWEGMVAVGEVIRNRMRKHYFSNGTVQDTVLRPFQFSGWNTQDHNRIHAALLDAENPFLKKAHDAWEASRHTDHTGGALLYHANTMDPFPSWAEVSTLVATIGHHLFYLPTSKEDTP